MRNIKQIPPVFWLGVSISMCLISSGITYSLIRGSELQVEAVDTKLILTGKIQKTQQITQDLQQVSQELKKTNPPSARLKEIQVIEQELEKAEKEIEEIQSVIIEDQERKQPGLEELNPE